jgi:hypothetical protein
MDKQFTFVFSTAEINVILNALGSMPYVQVVKVIENIQVQAESQGEKKADE